MKFLRQAADTVQLSREPCDQIPKGETISDHAELWPSEGLNQNRFWTLVRTRRDGATDARAVFPDCAFTLVEPQVEMKRTSRSVLLKRTRLPLDSSWCRAEEWLECHSRWFPDTVSSSFAFTEEQATFSGYEQTRDFNFLVKPFDRTRNWVCSRHH